MTFHVILLVIRKSGKFTNKLGLTEEQQEERLLSTRQKATPRSTAYTLYPFYCIYPLNILCLTKAQGRDFLQSRILGRIMTV